MSAVPEVEARNVAWQPALSAVRPDKLQLESKVPVEVPPSVKVTIPTGAVGLASVSVTVAVQVDA